ncbi:MAG: DUF302 domain-containing protein [Acidimicrobiia bacterium]
MTPYHFSLTIRETFDEAVTRTREALAEHGFGIVSEIDMAATFKEKLGVDHEPYLILGACNPGFAFQAVAHEPSIGVLLPCNVVVRQAEDNRVMIDFMDPSVMLDLVGEKSVHNVAEEVRTRLEMTRDAIAVGSRTVPAA